MVDFRQAAAHLFSRSMSRPEVGVICGSGLSGLSAAMTNTQVFQYSDIPGFPEPTVAGHAGELVMGELSGVPTICMRGRFHFYEGHPMSLVTMPVRVMRCLGVKVLIVTTAAGGLNPTWNVGDIMCIMDHFAVPCLVGQNPLMGANDDELGPRFMPISNAYDKEMQEVVVKSAQNLGFNFVRSQGCHAMVSGPTYESATEGKWLRQLGVDSVSMSTVPEIIAAHHCGIKIIGLSLITNAVVMPGETGAAASHEEVLETVASRSSQMKELVGQIVVELKPKLRAMSSLPAIDLQKHSQRAQPSAFGIGIAATVTVGLVAALAGFARSTTLLDKMTRPR